MTGLTNRKFGWLDRPLFDARVIRLADQEHMLFWGFHHLISDYVTRTLLQRELYSLYDAFLQGQASPISARPMQFSEYRAWQQHAYRSWQMTHQPYWEERLDGAVGLRWPKEDRTQSKGAEASIGTCTLNLSAALSAGLKGLARRMRMPVSIEVLAVYIAVVSQWCNQKDFIVTTTASGRDRAEHQGIAGFLAHPIYLRIQLSGNESFVDLLKLVRREYYLALSHKDFGNLVMDVPDLSGGALFQWFPTGCIAPPSAEVESLSSHVTGTVYRFDNGNYLGASNNIMLILGESENTISGLATYRESAFSAKDIARFIEDLSRTSERLVADPQTRVLS